MNSKSYTKSTDDIDPEQWLAAMPTPPYAVCARLKDAGVTAYLFRRDTKGVWLRIRSTFFYLPVVQQILMESGVHRSNWPRPRSQSKKCSLKLSIRFKWAGPPLSEEERLLMRITALIKDGFPDE